MARDRKSTGGRASKSAIEKRRTARALNALLTDGVRRGDRLDGRTQRRRARLVKELKEGRSGRALKPIDYVSHVHELLEMGETVASIKRHGVKPRKTEATEEVMELVARTQEAYNFRPQAWRMLGIRLPTERASKARKATKKKTKKSVRRG